MKVRIELDIEVKVTPWKRTDDWPGWTHENIAAVRIWLAHDGYRWWQCHEWEHRVGNRERTFERWIMSPAKALPPHAKDPEPGDEMPPWRP